jgi:hypothetical protein
MNVGVLQDVSKSVVDSLEPVDVFLPAILASAGVRG